MIEVLVTIVILTFGLLGLAGFQTKIQVAEMESYQRSQALILLEDMVERIRLANPMDGAAFSAYVVADPLGTGDGQPADCSGTAMGAARDRCEWSNALKGSAETASGGAKIGAMIGARGCIEQMQAPNPAAGVCTPGTFRITVAWQGLSPTAVPVEAIGCGKDLYGADNLRRAVSAPVTIGLPSC